jgi:hypothetical protein
MRATKMIDIKEIKKLVEASGLGFKECGKGHLQLFSDNNLVNYYPNSKLKTAYSSVLEKKVLKASVDDAIALCLEQPEPKEDKPFEPFTTNPAGIEHFYSGDKTPWEFDSFISAQSDRQKIAEFKLQRRAAGRAEITDLQRAAREMMVKHGIHQN